MTQGDIAQVKAMIETSFPRIAQGQYAWTTDDWRVFASGIMYVECELKAVQIALDEHKRSSKEFPSVQAMTDLMRRINEKRARVENVGKTVEHSPSQRLRDMQRRNGVPYGASKVEIIVADYRAWARCSVRIRGSCPEEPYYGLFRADMKELANATDREIDEQWYAIVEEALATYEQEPGLAAWDVHKMRQKLQALMKHVEPVKENAA